MKRNVFTHLLLFVNRLFPFLVQCSHLFLEVVFTFHATGAPPLTWNAPKKELDSEDDWGFQRYKPSASENELTEHRFVAVQKLREKKLVSEDGTLEIVTKITREQQSKNVSFDMHQRDEDWEGLACQVGTFICTCTSLLNLHNP